MRTYTMDTLPIELLELICGQHRQVVGNIRQVCAAFRQIRGDWAVLYNTAYGLLTQSEMMAAECSQESHVIVFSLLVGGEKVHGTWLHSAASARNMIAAEYIRMLRGETLVLAHVFGSLMKSAPYNCEIWDGETVPPRRENSIYIALIPAHKMAKFDPENVFGNVNGAWIRS